MMTISTATAAILETRERRLATVCLLAGWAAFAVALATTPSGVSLDPVSYAGGIGGTLGIFFGTFWRESSKGARHAFTVAASRAGLLVALWLAAILVALVLHPVLRTDGYEAKLFFGIVAIALFFLGAWLWGRGRHGEKTDGVSAT